MQFMLPSLVNFSLAWTKSMRVFCLFLIFGLICRQLAWKQWNNDIRKARQLTFPSGFFRALRSSESFDFYIGASARAQTGKSHWHKLYLVNTRVWHQFSWELRQGRRFQLPLLNQMKWLVILSLEFSVLFWECINVTQTLDVCVLQIF